MPGSPVTSATPPSPTQARSIADRTAPSSSAAPHERPLAGGRGDGEVDGHGRGGPRRAAADSGRGGCRRHHDRAGGEAVPGRQVDHPGRGRARHGGGQEVVVPVDDAALEVEDLAAGLDAQLQAQDAADLAGRAEGVGPAAGAVAGHDELGPVALVERLVDHQPLEQGQDLAVAAQGQKGVGATLLRHPVQAPPVVQGLVGPAGARELGQWVAAPQCQCVVEGADTLGEVGLVDPRHDQLLELDGVDVVGDDELVAARP